MWFRPILILVLTYFGFNGATSDEPELIASTKLGKIKGTAITTLSGRKIVGFKGIPFAEPPVGPLRFEAPQKHQGFQGILDATKDRDDCLQSSLFYNSYKSVANLKKAVGSEDCLYLNVYTPKVKPSALYPVMVFIHGGAFSLGSGSSVLAGPELLLDKDIVLVTFNYRLSILGFLTVDDGIVPGNMGLKDQNLALKWIKEHIQEFGGDPNRITLFGQCSGAASIHFHALSPHSKNLFHRAILQSGSAFANWVFQKPGQSKSTNKKIAKYLNCPTKSKAFLDCLRTKSGYDLINATVSLGHPLATTHFTPTFEAESPNAFATNDLFTHNSSIPFIMGVNSAEGIFAKIAYNSLKSKLREQSAAKAIFLSRAKNVDEIMKKLKKYYVRGEEDLFDPKIFAKSAMIVGDVMFVLPFMQACEHHKGQVYLYYLTHRPQRSLISMIGISNEIDGASHGDDLSFVLANQKLIPSNLKFNSEDKRVVESVIDYWTNFATYGSPSGGKCAPLQVWEPSDGCIKYIELAPKLTMKQYLLKDRVEFQKRLLGNVQWKEENE